MKNTTENRARQDQPRRFEDIFLACRSDLNRLIARITAVCVKELKAKPEQVRVVINELAKGNYAVAGKPV